MKDVLHRGDRAMIYIFIASSYFPWLSLAHKVQLPAVMNMKSSTSLLSTLLSWLGVDSILVADLRWTVWFLAAMGILYQHIFHEKYKWLETLIYVATGLLPSLPFIHGVSIIFASRLLKFVNTALVYFFLFCFRSGRTSFPACGN